jgi:hypothetical protein
MSSSNSLYTRMVEVTADYLGPAADRFIDRQIQSHLNKKPEELTRKDITFLISWSTLAMALLTDDSTIVNEFTSRLAALSK